MGCWDCHNRVADLSGGLLRNNQSKRRAISVLPAVAEESSRICVFNWATTILHFNGDAVRAHRENKIHLWLAGSLWEPCHVQPWHTHEVVAEDALDKMASEASQRCAPSSEFMRINRDMFLQERVSNEVVADTYPRRVGLPFQLQFLRANLTEKHGVFKELNRLGYLLFVNSRLENLVELLGQCPRPDALPSVPTQQPPRLGQQSRVVPPPTRRYPNILLDRLVNNGA